MTHPEPTAAPTHGVELGRLTRMDQTTCEAERSQPKGVGLLGRPRPAAAPRKGDRTARLRQLPWRGPILEIRPGSN